MKISVPFGKLKISTPLGKLKISTPLGKLKITAPGDPTLFGMLNLSVWLSKLNIFYTGFEAFLLYFPYKYAVN